MDDLPHIKIVLVGPSYSGKTSILSRYIEGTFNGNSIPSTQPAFFTKEITVHGVKALLDIWDTAGQERYRSLSPLFYHDANAGIVVFDRTERKSFDGTSGWVNELHQERGDQIFIMIAANKTDLENQIQVSLNELEEFSSSLGVDGMETSAKTGENIQLLFETIATKCIERLPDFAQRTNDPIKPEPDFCTC